MASEDIRELRRVLRFRNMIVRTSVKMKNKISGLLMEVGVSYNKKRLHGRRYFNELFEKVEDVPPSVNELLKLSRSVLIEAAKLAPRWNQRLAEIHARQLNRGNRNRATLAVARKLVAYMLAVEKRLADFKLETGLEAETALEAA
jgi:hypothetical protein